MLTSVEGVYENGVVHLLEPLPGMVRARVVVTVLPDAEASRSTPSLPVQPDSPENREAKTESPTGDAVSDSYQARTDLGRKLLALRRAHVQAGGRLLSWDEIDAEVSERRGGAADD